MSASSIGLMLKERLKQAGLYRGQTTHGTRRGKMQEQYYNAGSTLETVMKRSQIRTKAIGMRYLDRYAHLS